MTSPSGADDRLVEVFRMEHASVVGALVRRYGDLQLAEDATADALEVALTRWPRDGVPPNPGGWLTTTAGRKALDRLRRESSRFDREKEATSMLDGEAEPLGAVDDDRLRLLFLCCHPALALEARVGLTLRLVSGLSMPEIAAAFLTPERTMAQRLTRAKRKIREAHIPFRIPLREDLPRRLSGVLAVLYLTFNEGYLSVADESGTRIDLADEAIRLTREVCSLLPAEPEPPGLLALMLLTRARQASRVVEGRLVPLESQDRCAWNVELIVEGRGLVRSLLGLGRPGAYQVQAAIAAAHTDEVVDWPQVVALYDLLSTLDPSPVVRLNRALAVSRVEGPRVALALVETLELSAYHPWHVARAHLLERLARPADAVLALDAALEIGPTSLERAHLIEWRGRLNP